MADVYSCNIPKLNGGTLELKFHLGTTTIIVGANGAGKTRLGVHIENAVSVRSVQRIAAQKSLFWKDDLNLLPLEYAEKNLRFGRWDAQEGQKHFYRWGQKPATHFLSDFDGLLQSLFASHNRVASKHLQMHKADPTTPPPTTKLEQLSSIWNALLPLRKLELLEANVRVHTPGSNASELYPASDMSDGERAIFYFLGQSLLAPDNGLIIIDEPEAHIHKAILIPLWDAIQKARPDCAFIFITHDIVFAASHTASAKYYIRQYSHKPLAWDLEPIPDETGVPEQVVAELVGSRKPILFVEGERGSLDMTIYSSIYSGFSVVPVGSCEAVIHSVESYRRNSTLHWLEVRGLVDADDRDTAEIERLRQSGISVLPVAEVENVLLLPNVFLAIADLLFSNDPQSVLEELKEAVINEARSNLEIVSARYTTRQLDRRLKRVTVNARDLSSLVGSYQTEIASIDPQALFRAFEADLLKKIADRDLPGILLLYDSKGLVARAASLLGLKGPKPLLERLGRLLGTDNGQKLRKELVNVLPVLTT